MIGSIDPIIATTSDNIDPSTIGASPCKFEAHADRIFNFQGSPVPSETMKNHNSPFGDSIAVYVSPISGAAP